ncbi:calcium-binding protein [Marinivivus vitaminiproducens]|uniref:calcium-binding protein n=1 Tax=Marinivivus vitaminiproducens TaxID=3035935 RepID=UPI0027A43F5F|nr:hypothetical protein P4R82_16000 [Geminicoccaceae bacterium SCSIO 64248]
MHPDSGEVVWLADKAGSSLSFSATATDTRLEGDSNRANVNDAMIYDLIINGVRDFRFEGFTAFSLGSGADVLNLTVRDADPAFAYDLDVSASGRTGSDVIWTGTGDDRIIAGDGDDSIHAYDGDDTVYGDYDYARAVDDNDEDRIWGGEGADNLFGDTTTLNIGERTGDDLIYGGADDDTIRGDADQAQGYSSTALFVDGGHDTLYGGDGNDTIYGDFRLATGPDNVIGGDDKVIGGRGDDLMYGDAPFDGDPALFPVGLNGGYDRFVFARGSGSDRIMDFESGEDLLDVKGWGVQSFAELTISGNGTSSVLVEARTGETAAVAFYDEPLTLSTRDFVFA